MMSIITMIDGDYIMFFFLNVSVIFFMNFMTTLYNVTKIMMSIIDFYHPHYRIFSIPPWMAYLTLCSKRPSAEAPFAPRSRCLSVGGYAVLGVAVGTIYGGGYPLVNCHITMERSTIFNGKTHYFDWAIFHSYVSLPEGT